MMMDDEKSIPSRWARRFHLIFLLMGLGALAWLLHQVGLDTLGNSLAMVGWGFLLSTSAHFLAIVMDSFTLRAAMSSAGPSISFWQVLRASLAGHAINEATPLSKLGEVTKYTLIAEHISNQRAAAALIVQNIIMFVVNCTLMVLAPLASIAILDIDSDFTLLLLITAGVFGVLALGTVLLLIRGPGELPFRLARRVGLGNKRVERWRSTWKNVEAHWQEAIHDRNSLGIALVTGVASRMASVTEFAIILRFLGAEDVLAMAALTLAGSQVVTWSTSFIPMQAGTSEGGAYLLYRQIGISPGLGVVVELVRRMRRLVFIGIGVALLGWQTFREFTSRRD
jgi:uncharacterized membrane protein YbhN (UPF0104 family)